jgi:hypothetical protein
MFSLLEITQRLAGAETLPENFPLIHALEMQGAKYPQTNGARDGEQENAGDHYSCKDGNETDHTE